MASRFETREIERSLLNLCVGSKMILRGYIHQMDMDWFTSKERQYIFEHMNRTFETSRSALTTKLLQHELAKEADISLAARIETEWGLIENITVHESPDALVQLLEEAVLGRKTARICERAFVQLEKGDVSEAVDLLRHETIFLGQHRLEKPTTLLTDYQKRLDLLRDKMANPQKYRGILTGFPTFDNKTGGLFPAELTVFSAVTGVGKSTMLKQIAYNLIQGGFNVLFVTNEESEEQVQRKFDALCSLLDYLRLKKVYDLQDEEIQRWIDMMEKLKGPDYGSIYIKEIEQFSTVVGIERAFMELEQQSVRIDVIIIDYMDHIAPRERPWSENDEQAKVAANCKGLSVTLNKPVVTATQAATIVEEKTEKKKGFGKMDVYGSKRKVHAANTLAGITEGERLEDAENLQRDEWERDIYWTVTISKNRDGPPFHFQVLRRVRTGLVVEEKFMNAPDAKEEMNVAVNEMDAKPEELPPVDGKIQAVFPENKEAKRLIESPEAKQGLLTISDGIKKSKTLPENANKEIANVERIKARFAKLKEKGL